MTYLLVSQFTEGAVFTLLDRRKQADAGGPASDDAKEYRGGGEGRGRAGKR